MTQTDPNNDPIIAALNGATLPDPDQPETAPPPPPFEVLVSGGRTFFNFDLLQERLEELARLRPITLIIHGGAAGADTLAGKYAETHRLPCARYLPSRRLDGQGRDWKFRRNTRMLNTSEPDLVVAFPGGPGTAHMVRTAQAAGYPVWDLRSGSPSTDLTELIA